jgi:predicted nuclease of predicted toxin-antitoxin system
MRIFRLHRFGYYTKRDITSNIFPTSYPSTTDTDVTELAIRENRIILTFDGDFGTLIFRFGYRPPGVIYFRLQNITADEPAHIVMTLLRQDYTFLHRLTVVESDKIRQRLIPEQ